MSKPQSRVRNPEEAEQDCSAGLVEALRTEGVRCAPLDATYCWRRDPEAQKCR